MVVGYDFFPSNALSLSPYLGFGYRRLQNDLRGHTSTGAVGYRRDSTYRYIPVGLVSRINVGGQWIVSPTVEYDVFKGGEQRSRLTDTGIGFDDASNTQSHGYGYRVSVMIEYRSFEFGPWMHYWKIKDSDIVSIGGGFGALEPENWTREVGVEFRYRF